MSVQRQIKEYIANLPEPKRSEMQALHKHILQVLPKCKLRFLDGKDGKGKIVSNPNIGYGSYTIKYADGTTREFYQIGLSANTTGISVYIMGIKDKTYIQPFEDGNKRTARLTANALLMAANACPLSYRSISPSEYKKSILLFYEMNNVTAFKKIFIDQYQFAVENYF
ncbi:MAG: Fic family protein [Cyclobacteriaceae bacterium]